MLGQLDMNPDHLFHRFAYMKNDIPVAGCAHQAGTCRFGTDPASVGARRRTARAHELDNLYVVDTSVFPSIGAVNPALTAMANSLRVGDHLLGPASMTPANGAVRLSAATTSTPRRVTLTGGAPLVLRSRGEMSSTGIPPAKGAEHVRARGGSVLIPWPNRLEWTGATRLDGKRHQLGKVNEPERGEMRSAGWAVSLWRRGSVAKRGEKRAVVGRLLSRLAAGFAVSLALSTSASSTPLYAAARSAVQTTRGQRRDGALPLRQRSGIRT